MNNNLEKSYTFFGRDLYVHVGAKLASGKISFEKVGNILEEKPFFLKFPKHIKKIIRYMDVYLY